MGKTKYKPSHYNTKSSPVIVLTQAELNQIKNQVRKETVDTLSKYDVEVMLTCFASVLRRQYRWGYKRIFRALNGVDEMFGKVLSGELSDVEMRQQLEDEVGIKIRCDGGEENGIET